MNVTAGMADAEDALSLLSENTSTDVPVAAVRLIFST